MRSTTRRFLAAILLTAAAGFALSQEASAPPPPPAPEVAAPVAALPQIPVVAVEPVPDPNAPAVNPALTVDSSVLPAAPAAQAVAQVPEQKKLVATTTTKRVTKKSATKPVAKPEVQASEPLQSVPAPVAASAADPSTFQGLTPPGAAANTAPAQSVAPPPPAAKAAPLESSSEAVPQKKLGIGSWILFGIALVALAGIGTKFLRRRVQTPTAIVDFTGSSRLPELKPAPVPRA
jgi:hypothetical protein